MTRTEQQRIRFAADNGATEPQLKAMTRLLRARADRFGNTFLNFYVADRIVALTLHDTDIVCIHGDGLITLDSGGWQTVTTKRRINQALDALKPRILGKEMFAVRVWQEDFCWHLCSKRKPEHEFFEEDFVDGIYAGTVE